MIRAGEPLWTCRELVAATDGRSSGRWFADGIAIDSREVVSGDLFLAMPGGSQDGHDHVETALDAGASGAMVTRTPDGLMEDDPRLLYVRDVPAALMALGRKARMRFGGKALAVTGSAGKTSVRHALQQALGREKRAHASIRSFNNHVGVPLSLARMPREADFGIFEIGASAPGEIEPLSRLVRPEIAIITSVGSAHRAGFDSETAIAREKAGIFAGVAPGGHAVLNLDHPHAPLLQRLARERGLSITGVTLEKKRADVRLKRLAHAPDLSCLTADVMGTIVAAKVGAPGRHAVMNALLVLAAAKLAGGDLGLAALSVAEMRPLAGRGARYSIATRDGDFLLIDDSYNANPLSLAAAFDTLASLPLAGKGRKIAVLADMSELGDEAERLHLDLAEHLRAAGIAEVIALGPMTASMGKLAGVPVQLVADIPSAISALRKTVRARDAVLVKGSNAAGLSAVVHAAMSLGRAVPVGSKPGVLHAAE